SRQEERAEGDIACTGVDSLGGIVQIGLTGCADDSLRAQLLAGLAQRAVVTAQVYTDLQFAGQRQIIIDQQLRAMALAQLLELGGFLQPPPGIATLVPVLQQTCATGEGSLEDRKS